MRNKLKMDVENEADHCSKVSVKVFMDGITVMQRNKQHENLYMESLTTFVEALQSRCQ